MAEETVRYIIIHLWCGPRSLSTATMYSFAQRSDVCKVFDEPLYASWLVRNPGVFRPYRELLIEKFNIEVNKFGSPDPTSLLEKQIHDSILQDTFNGRRIIFLKHIAKQADSIDISKLLNTDPNLVVRNDGLSCTIENRHIILVRNPLPMISSWQKKATVHDEPCSLRTMGLPTLVDIYSELRRMSSKKTIPIVVDSTLLSKNPRGVIFELCERLQIPFDEKQLQWAKGPKPDIDGLWASYWYEQVHDSSGFSDKSEAQGSESALPSTLSEEQLDLYREALPFFDLLSRKAIGRDPLNPGSSLTPAGPTNPGSDNIVDHGLLMKGRQLGDPRNENLLAWVGDRLLPRELAKVSVFDSAVQGGDAVWEGLRVYKNTVFKLEEHLQRLLDSSKAMAFNNVPTRAFIKHAIFSTLAANGMTDGVHIRLTLTRGPKLTSSMNPAFNVFGCNLIVLPEWKPVGDAATYDNDSGIRLITATNRRNPPQCVDSKIHHCNLINNILPKIQANVSGAADALMLDLEGFVSETNATNVFMVKHNTVFTPHADYCLPGVTRQTVIAIVRDTLHLELVERRVSLAEFHSADEVFTTGTMGELTPVYEIDGRIIGPAEGTGGKGAGPITRKIQEAYRTLTKNDGYPIPSF